MCSPLFTSCGFLKHEPTSRCGGRGSLDRNSAVILAMLGSKPRNASATAESNGKTHPNPAEAHRRWRGRGASRSRLVSVHERSLCAQSPVQSEQCCCWTGLAAGSSLDDRHPGELRTPNAAAQTRTVSARRFWLSQRELPRHLKQIVRPRIPEFESYMPSQPVRSLWAVRTNKKAIAIIR